MVRVTSLPRPAGRASRGEPARRPPGRAKKATFNLDARLHQRLKVAAALHRRQMTELVEDALRLHLGALEKRQKTA